MRLTRAPIQDFCAGIYDGPHATPAESSQGPVFLGIRNLTQGGELDLTEIRHVSEDEYPKWTRRVVPRDGDVVFSYEATLHRYALIPDGFRGCLGRRVALVRPNPEKLDSRFLLYYFLSPAWRRIVDSNTVTGATVVRLPIERFPSFEIELPDLGSQQRIAEVLFNYDDLIANNQRRITLLEEAARQLYREWFVRLRFPGAEHTAVVDGLPEGWLERPLGECVRFRSGGTPNKARGDYWEGDIPWASSGELTQLRLHDTELHVSPEGADVGSRMVPANTILAVVRGMSLAREFRLSMTAREMAFNQDLKALICQDGVDPFLLFFALLDRREYIRDLATEA
ncbi:MAG: restriction endonuclease subunit S, partial [Gemmatimonadaceae bacterium]